ncbi:MAG TPA: hypothetical protein VF381_14570 [Thermoanaerobaculia bacterium]
MKKFVLLSSVLFLFATAGYSGAVVKAKSNISNNREGMCHGTVTRDAKGVLNLVCSGKCPDGECKIHERRDAEDNTIQWCGCLPDEPKDCHVVLVTPPKGHGEPHAACSSTGCDKPKTCKQSESKTGITCGCE